MSRSTRGRVREGALFINAESRQQFRQFIDRMQALADECIEVCGRNAKFVCNVCKFGAIEIADLADFPPVLEPVAKDINELVED